MDTGIPAWTAHVYPYIHMIKVIPVMEDVSLLIKQAVEGGYPCKLQKGLLLACGEKDLSEEGTGFGVPVLKLGHEAIFPGNARITTAKYGDVTIVGIDYDLNLVERMSLKGKRIDSRAFYRIKECFSSLHRIHPELRKMLTLASSNLRHVLGLETNFEEAASYGTVHVLYTIKGEEIRVSVNTSGVKTYTEMMLMNEQGANYFNKYRDSNGLMLSEDKIGTWDETFADEASFINPIHGIQFTLKKAAGSRMFRGRELVGRRLAWSGIAYMLPEGVENFGYNIRIRKA